MKNLGEALLNIPTVKLIRCWKLCAGPALWKQTKFLGIKRGPQGQTLHILVKDPIWRQELYYQINDILNRFRHEMQKHNFANSQLPTRCVLHSVESKPFRSKWGWRQSPLNTTRK